MFDVDDTVSTGDTILHTQRQQSDVIPNWSVSTTRGRSETLVPRKKAGHGDVSRYDWSWWSQRDVRWGYCRYIFCDYNRTDRVRLLRYPPVQKFKLKILSPYRACSQWICSIHHYSRSRKITSRESRTEGSSRPMEMLAWDDKIMSVVGHIDEIHILNVVRTVPIVGYVGGNTFLNLKPEAHNSLELIVIDTGDREVSTCCVGSHSWNVDPDTSSSTLLIHRLITRVRPPL